MSVNKAILIGNVGRGPEIRYTQSGESIASFSLATSEKWTGKDGQKQERTEWHNVSVFGKLAQVVRDYVQKGDKLYIEGAIKYEEWTDKDGQKRNTTKIHLGGFNAKLEMLGSKKDRGPSRPTESEPHPETGFQATDDDVPF